MDLVELMTGGADPQELALDRLESILDLYCSEDAEVQDEALARAISLCSRQWGSYKAGLEALARRKESRDGEGGDGALEALRLREEAEDPGALIRAARSRQARAAHQNDERAAIIARYGSEAVACRPTPFEQPFIDAARSLVDEAGDPWAPLAGWSLPWHDLPDALRDAVSTIIPLPATIGDARAETLVWDERKRELQVLSGGPGAAALPTACAARHKLVEALWRRDLPVTSIADLEARLEYWASRGGDDGSGYAVLLADCRHLAALVPATTPAAPGSRDRVQQLRAEHPNWSLARIGKELGISRQAVHKHLKALGARQS